MPLFDTLVDAYAEEGFAIAAGLNPTLFKDLYTTPFTWLIRDGTSAADGLGVSLSEVYFFEYLGQVRPAKSIFVIGNSFGWSSLALAMANPGGRVVAIDAGVDRYSREGLHLTARLAARLRLEVGVVRARSPQDVSRVVRRRLDGHIDLALVDGRHSLEQIVDDWRAVQPFLVPDAIVLFHDVAFLNLWSGYKKVVAESGWQVTVLHATTSGIGILVREPGKALGNVIRAFAVDPEVRAVVRAEALAHAHTPGYIQRRNALREAGLPTDTCLGALPCDQVDQEL
jgi:predicted O-methyltransferase YrrM